MSIKSSRSNLYLTSKTPVDSNGNKLVKNNFYMIIGDQLNIPLRFIESKKNKFNNNINTMYFNYYFFDVDTMRTKKIDASIVSRNWVQGLYIIYINDENVMVEGDTDSEDEDEDSVGGGSMQNKRIKTTIRGKKNKTTRRRKP